MQSQSIELNPTLRCHNPTKHPDGNPAQNHALRKSPQSVPKERRRRRQPPGHARHQQSLDYRVFAVFALPFDKEYKVLIISE